MLAVTSVVLKQTQMVGAGITVGVLAGCASALLAVRFVEEAGAGAAIFIGVVVAVLVAALILIVALWRSRRRHETTGELSALASALRDLDLFGEARAELEFNATGATGEVADAVQHLLGRLEQYKWRLHARDRRIRRVLGNITDILFQTDAELRVTWVSASVERVMGYSVDEIHGRNIEQFIVNGGRDDAAIQSRLDLTNHPVRAYRRDGSVAWLLVTARRLQDAEGGLLGFEGTLRDGTELVEAEKALFTERERAQITLASIGDSVLTTTVDGVVDYMNASAKVLVGNGHALLEGAYFDDICQLRDSHTDKPVTHLVEACVEAEHEIGLHAEAILHNAQEQRDFAVRVNVSPIRDGRSEIVGTVVVLHDITELREISRQMTYQATHDGLTGLANRQAFESSLRDLLSHTRLGERTHALCYLDLDQFKVVNDTCGHAAGDELLRRISVQLASQLRDRDVIARLGGDEFGILLSDTTLEQATRTAQRMCDCIADFRFDWENNLFRIGASVGLVPVTRDSGDFSSVLSSADTACYVAKDNGRNRVYVHIPDNDEVISHRSDMERMQHVSESINDDSLVLLMQVISPANRRPGDRIGLECLVRMRAADGKLLRPSAFLPVAERYHIMPRIDRWVLENTLSMVADTALLSSQVDYFSINLSAQSIVDEHFIEFALDLLQRSSVNPERLVFEITESSAVTNFTRAVRLIKVLRDTGCRVALDDFGSGLSSFSYLKNLPLDFIKIDGSFVRNILTDPVDFETVRAINQVSHTMGLMTIAEHVESEEALQELRTMGVDYVQGYHIGRPVSFEEWARNNVDACGEQAVG